MNRFAFYKENRVKLISLSILMILIAGYFSLRGVVLQQAISRLNSTMNANHYSAHWEGERFKGISTVFVRQLYIRSTSGDDEAQIDSLAVRVRITPLLFGNIRFSKLECSSVLIRYHSVDSVPQKSKEAESDTLTLSDYLKGKNFAASVNNNIRRFFHYVPSKLKFGDIGVDFNYKGNNTRVTLHHLIVVKGNMSGSVIFRGNNQIAILPLSGNLNKQESLVSLQLVCKDTSLLPVPVLMDRYGIAAGFDSLSLSIDFSQSNRRLVKMTGKFSFAGFELNGNRISTEKVRINHFVSGFKINIGTNYLEVDSSTVTTLNQVSLNPYIRLTAGDHTVISFKILPVSWQSQRFFNSLPEGMFTSLRGIDATGTLNYHLAFSVDLENPDSLYFDTKLTSDDFRIVKYGMDDYRLINGSFRYQAFDKGRLMATFIVGPDNPDFVALDQISPFLRAAVMTSEDGSFYFHNGFNPDAFRESIATNIKEGRFARGGSTITMQLVKNVFLTRNKTIARKIEEALIVWLIENKNLVPKQRMYEVYLNIIEWGPGIYGVNQASHFYFNKRPADLSLQESVYMASIVPRPKWYKYTFEQNGIMRPFYMNYFKRLKELMVRKEFIVASDTIHVAPEVLLTGPASLAFSDTTSVRSVRDFEEMEMLPAINYFDRKSFN